MLMLPRILPPNRMGQTREPAKRSWIAITSRAIKFFGPISLISSGVPKKTSLPRRTATDFFSCFTSGVGWCRFLHAHLGDNVLGAKKA